MSEMIEKQGAVNEVRLACYQFADLYFFMARQLREEFGDETAIRMCTKILFDRACDRALDMRRRAEEQNTECTLENIKEFKDIPYLGWVPELGRNHCPYGEAWIEKIDANPWFKPYALLYCDVNDTTVGEVYLQTHSHRITKNVLNGDSRCDRVYFTDENVAKGIYTYGRMKSE